MHNLKFLLDADMPTSSAEVIRRRGYEVEDVRDIGLRYAKDKEIIEYALKNKRIIITRDTDFGEVLRYPKHPGAIIFRLPYAFTANEISITCRFISVTSASRFIILLLCYIDIQRF